MTDYANYMRDDPEEMYLTFMKDVQPETSDGDLAKLFDGMKGAFESKGFGDAFGADGFQNMKGFRDMVRLHRNGDVASIADNEAYLSALDVMERIRKLPEQEVVRPASVLPPPPRRPGILRRVPREAAPVEAVKEAPAPEALQPLDHPERPGMGSSPEPTTRPAPEMSSSSPVARGRPEMPKFLRDVEDRHRASAERLKAKVVNRTETALPPKERLRRNTDFEYGTPATGMPSPKIIAEAAMQMSPPMHMISGNEKSEAPMRQSRPGFGANQVPYLVPKPRPCPPMPALTKASMEEKPQIERSGRRWRPGWGPVRAGQPTKAPVPDFKEVGVWGAMEPKTNVSSESHRKGAFRSPAHPPGITL
jgi:hypothetical protein